MREILYRGKRKDNGDWVEGYYTELPCGSLGATIFSNDDELVCEDTKSYIIKVFTKQHTNYSNSNPLQVIECEKYEVIPETVEQFTGLHDKNGNKIFEGDIVKVTYTERRQYQGVSYQDKHSCIEEVIYSEESACFMLKIMCESIPLYRPLHNFGSQANIKELEAIGNVFDNLELLEEL